MSTYGLHVSEPSDTPPGERWCSLWGPRGPCRPSIEGTADEWLLIAGAIEAGASRAFGRVAFAPEPSGGRLWSPRNSVSERDHAVLTAAECEALARSIREQLATARATASRPDGARVDAVHHGHGELASALAEAKAEYMATPPRPPCRCTFEAGDSRCERHPACAECGEPTIARRNACAEHASEPRGTWSNDRPSDATAATAAGDDRTAADCAGELEALLAGGGR